MSDGDEHEGYVVRDSGCFSYDEFEYHVAKWVRPHHVQTDSFWLSKPIVKNELATQNEP
jgi:hypothetical protein